MTDILTAIDDTLAEWHGSADSMRWRPEPTPEQAEPTPEQARQARQALAQMASIVVPAFRTLCEQVTAAWQGMQPLLVIFDEIQAARPSALDARYHQRQRNRRRRKR